MWTIRVLGIHFKAELGMLRRKALQPHRFAHYTCRKIWLTDYAILLWLRKISQLHTFIHMMRLTSLRATVGRETVIGTQMPGT